MSGIAGIYYLDGQPVQRRDLARMVDVLAHRGPDGVEIWCEDAIGLGHRMLWTTPESLSEKLPLVKGQLAITADARIDNREELISALGFVDYPVDKVTDSDLILAAYEEWGDRCPEHLLGDFAFVIWDGRTQQLFCVRDHFGVKPLYYYHQPDVLFAFASEIKALLSLPGVPRRLNEARIADHLLQIYDQASTFYQQIYRCLPAHTLRVSTEQIHLKQYWMLDADRELRLSDAEYAEAYREAFVKAVDCRLRSTYPIGSMLSGGLDSSSIVCVARQILQQRGDRTLKTFSAIFDDVPESDERPFIQAVLNGGGLEPHFIHGDRLSLLTHLPKMLCAQDEPFDAPNSFLNWAVWQQTQQQDTRILLDGLMGDGVVSYGYGYLSDLAASFRWITLAQELNALAHRCDCSPWFPLWLYIWNDGIKANLPASLRNGWRQQGDQPAICQPPKLLNPDFVRRTGLVDRLQAQQPTQWRSAREQHYQELTSGIISHALEVYNKGAATFTIESRFPFLDVRLVELCLAMPASQKLKNGWSRAIVRYGLGDYLPDRIRWRNSKGNLSPNFMQTLQRDSSQAEAMLSNSAALLPNYLDRDALQQLEQTVFSQSSHQEPPEANTFLLAVTLASWLRDKEAASAPSLAGYPFPVGR